MGELTERESRDLKPHLAEAAAGSPFGELTEAAARNQPHLAETADLLPSG